MNEKKRHSWTYTLDSCYVNNKDFSLFIFLYIAIVKQDTINKNIKIAIFFFFFFI
jgi:hypothetical protein